MRGLVGLKCIAALHAYGPDVAGAYESIVICNRTEGVHRDKSYAGPFTGNG